MKKTYQKWEKTGEDLDDFLGNSPCEMDEDMYNYIAGDTPPSYLYKGLVQCGEASRTELGIPCYTTVSYIDGKYFYLGILPEFNQ